MNRIIPNSYKIIPAEQALDPIADGAQPVDTIIPLTYTTIPHQFGGASLSRLSEVSIDAAVSLAEVHTESKIIIASERTFGQESPSTAELMEKFAIEAGIDKRRIRIVNRNGEAFDNTPRQLQGLKYYIKYQSLRWGQNLGRNVMAVAFDYHLPRIFSHSRSQRLRLPLNGVVAAEVIEAAGKADEYPELDFIKYGMPKFRAWEDKVAFVAKLDRAGYLLNLLTRIRGPQVHDLVYDPETDETEEVIETAKSFKVRQLGQLAARSQ